MASGGLNNGRRKTLTLRQPFFVGGFFSFALFVNPLHAYRLPLKPQSLTVTGMATVPVSRPSRAAATSTAAG